MPTGTDPARPERRPRDVFREHGLRARKDLGQNFLVSAKNLDRVVEAASIAPAEVVLEIGTGLGRLTARIARSAARVVTVEIDRALHRIAAENLRDTANVTLLCCDFLKGKHRISPAVTEAVRPVLTEEAPTLKVVSNLPYGISSPAIVNLLEWEVPVGEMYLMLQKEVADRLSAQPGRREYGPLTVYVDYWATVKRLFSLPRRAFWPVPEVSSALMKVARRPEREHTEQYDVFAAVVRRLLANRRKTLGHNLRKGWGRELSGQVLVQLGLDPERRAETLSTADFEAIAAAAGPPRTD